MRRQRYIVELVVIDRTVQRAIEGRCPCVIVSNLDAQSRKLYRLGVGR